jgi:hypothetical protein
MGDSYSVSIKGSKQGQFRGQLTPRGGHRSIPLVGFELSTIAPTDAATGGNGSGKHRRPIRIAVEFGEFSQQLFQAFAHHEVLDEVIIRRQQQLQVANTVRLTNGTIASYAIYCAQGFGAPSSLGPTAPRTGSQKPQQEVVGHTIQLTGASILGYKTYHGPKPNGGNRGQQPVSFELDYNDIQVLPFRR